MTLPKIATLSFDDGHEHEERLCDALRAAKVSATFYLVGDRLPRLNRKWYDGMEIGNHTMTHPHLFSMDSAAIIAEYSMAARALADWGAENVTGLSYPYGQASFAAVQQAWASWKYQYKTYRFSYARTFAIDPDNAYIIPEPFLAPVTDYHDRPGYGFWQKQAVQDKPIHLAGHGYAYDSPEKVEGLLKLIVDIREQGYLFVNNQDYIRACRTNRE